MKTNKITNILLVLGLICLLISSAANAQTIPTNGLLYYYPFNGNANDMSGNNNNGLANATLIFDRFGNNNKAYYFDGVDDQIYLPNASLPFNNKISFSCWIFNTGSKWNNEQTIMSFARLSNYDISLLDGGHPTNPLAIKVKAVNGSEIKLLISPSNSVRQFTWHHIAIVTSSGNIKLFIDGQLQGSISDAFGVSGNAPIECFGVDGHQSQYHFKGCLDDIRIYYDAALSDADIQNLYHEGGYYPVNPNETAEIWNKDENSNINYNDGNVGIGTTTPSQKFHVDGNSLMSGNLYLNTDSYINGTAPHILDIYSSGTHSARFKDQSIEFNKEIFTNNGVFISGNVGIGTTVPDEKLTVKGKIHAEEIIVDLNIPQPDYVFEEEYKLKSLTEVEEFIKTNKHLPEIPSAKEVEENGITLGEMQTKLLKKIEELTLYSIEQNKKIEFVIRENSELKTQNKELTKRIEKLENN